MTPSQQLRRMGFLESLRIRGVTLYHREQEFRALLEKVEPDNPEQRIAPSDSVTTRLIVLREHLPPSRISIQDIITGENEEKYRVMEIQSNPVSIEVAFLCRTKPE